MPINVSIQCLATVSSRIGERQAARVGANAHEIGRRRNIKILKFSARPRARCHRQCLPLSKGQNLCALHPTLESSLTGNVMNLGRNQNPQLYHQTTNFGAEKRVSENKSVSLLLESLFFFSFSLSCQISLVKSLLSNPSCQISLVKSLLSNPSCQIPLVKSLFLVKSLLLSFSLLLESLFFFHSLFSNIFFVHSLIFSNLFFLSCTVVF